VITGGWFVIVLPTLLGFAKWMISGFPMGNPLPREIYREDVLFLRG
jgi:hypothetical protein